MHIPHGHQDSWEQGLQAYENSVMLGFMLIVSIFEMSYHVLRNRITRSVSTIFIFNLIFFAYASCVVVAHGAIRQAVRMFCSRSLFHDDVMAFRLINPPVASLVFATFINHAHLSFDRFYVVMFLRRVCFSG